MILVLTSVPDEKTGRKIAEELVGDRLAACVHLLSPHTAVYRWKGVLEMAPEQDLLIKTTEERYEALEQAILALHPYELPAIIKIPVTGGNSAFLDWVRSETA